MDRNSRRKHRPIEMPDHVGREKEQDRERMWTLMEVLKSIGGTAKSTHLAKVTGLTTGMVTRTARVHPAMFRVTVEDSTIKAVTVELHPHLMAHPRTA